MKKEKNIHYLCKDCEWYNSCEYYHNRRKDSFICKYFHLPNEHKTDELQTFEILKEIKNDCKNRYGCKGCKFFPCKICDLPAYWDI